MDDTLGMKTWFKKTFIDVLDEAAERYADKIAFIFKGKELTYKKLHCQVNKLAKGLIKLGVRKDDHVSIWLPNSLEWIICKFATIKAGGVVIPVNTRYKSKEAEYILKQSDSTTLFMTDQFLRIDYLKMFEGICPEIKAATPGNLNAVTLPTLKRVILLGGENSPGFLNYSDVMKGGEWYSDYSILKERKNSIKPSDVVNIQYTSGTTGQPKGVMLTHRMLLGAYAITQILQLTERDRLILPLPLFHCFANLNGLLPFLMTGGSVVLMDVFDPEEELRLIEKYHCTVIYGVPTMYTMMLEHPRFNKYDLSSLRTGNLGGSPPPIKLVKGIIHRMGVKDLTANYGMTENSCSICATRIGDSPEVIATTVGRPFPLVEARIVDINTRKPLPPGKPGLVYVRGPYVMKSYYNKPGETKMAIDSEGWLNTGDLAKLDQNGNFIITGRYKDLIMPGGENVSPAEVENIIFDHPAVKSVAVIGVPDNRLGEVVAANIILKEGTTCSEQEIIDFCKPRMANFKVPRHILFVKEFPMTPTGKIQNFKLREQTMKKLDQRRRL
jgi:fatty-acyl-CoA synthase